MLAKYINDKDVLLSLSYKLSTHEHIQSHETMVNF